MPNKALAWMSSQRICPICEGKFLPIRKKQIYDQPYCRRQAHLRKKNKAEYNKAYQEGLEEGKRESAREIQTLKDRVYYLESKYVPSIPSKGSEEPPF